MHRHDTNVISLQLPLVDEVAKRTLEFSRKRLSSESTFLSHVAYHGLHSAGMNSPFALSFNRCSYFNTSTSDL